MILFVNACVREGSRTKILADYLLSRLQGEVKERFLGSYVFPVADSKFIDTRSALLERKQFDDPSFELAREFAAADTIVVAAPYWDLSFPAALKQYFEQVNAIGITFRYSESGSPVGLCRGKKLYYVTTSGGPFAPDEYGYGYVQMLCRVYYGIRETHLIKASGLDVWGADTEAIVVSAKQDIDLLFKEN